MELPGDLEQIRILYVLKMLLFVIVIKQKLFSIITLLQNKVFLLQNPPSFITLENIKKNIYEILTAISYILLVKLWLYATICKLQRILQLLIMVMFSNKENDFNLLRQVGTIQYIRITQ